MVSSTAPKAYLGAHGASYLRLGFFITVKERFLKRITWSSKCEINGAFWDSVMVEKNQRRAMLLRVNLPYLAYPDPTVCFNFKLAASETCRQNIQDFDPTSRGGHKALSSTATNCNTNTDYWNF